MNQALQRVQQAAQRLQQEGKTVNLALLRARLAGQLNGAELLTAYQQWRAQPQDTLTASVTTDAAASPTISESEDLAATLARIEQKLDRLLHLLDTDHVSG